MNGLMSFPLWFMAATAGLPTAPTQPVPDGGAPPTTQKVANLPVAVSATQSPIASRYPTATAALRALLQSEPRVVAVGEFHQTKATAGIPSAIKRFTSQMLGPLREAGATDLVVETWITTGSCGEVEKKTVVEIEETTKRPRTTENEVVTLLRRAKDSGIQPHILEVACKDYQAMMVGGEVDFERLLRLTRDQLELQIRAALARPGKRFVVSYGGALHNDLRPPRELAPYAFGQVVSGVVDGHYVELDLYVPELVEKNATIRAQPWFEEYRRAYRPGKVTLVQRSQSSFALVFPRSR